MKGPISSFRVPYLGVLIALAGCGSSTITDNGADGPVVLVPDAPITSTADARVSCTSAIQCAVGQTCDKTTMKCASNVACNTNSDCGNQAFCNNHVCMINSLRGPCDTSDNCISDETCTGGHCGCDGVLLTATVVAPNMLIALDRSQSMNTEVGSTGLTRWDVARMAMTTIANKYQNAIRFGLVLWPGTNKQCSGGSDCMGINDAVTINFNTAMAISDYMNTATKCSLGTPIAGTLTALDSFAGLNDTTRANYVVLMTDGEQNNCTGDAGAAAAALRTHNPPVKTFAVGFGQEAATTGAPTLNAIATNGGTARSGDPKYYQADSLSDLENAFDMIGGQIVSCDYTLSMDITDPTKVFVFLGSSMLARDTTHTNGWDFNTTTKNLTFYGAACSDIMSSNGSDLSVSFGCPVIQ